MRPESKNAERLLLLTLMLESAILSEDWVQVTELVNTRAQVIEGIEPASPEVVQQIGLVEERMLTLLRRRIKEVRSDLRNLSAALRIAAPYTQTPRPSRLSLAG